MIHDIFSFPRQKEKAYVEKYRFDSYNSFGTLSKCLDKQRIFLPKASMFIVIDIF